jgi:hypothetical protein
MRSSKGSRRIVVNEVEYRWRATGNDGYISIGIWPSDGIGPFLCGKLRYHESWVNNSDGSLSSTGDQIVITNRIIRRIIEYAIAKYGYTPKAQGNDLNLTVLDHLIPWNDAIRANDTPI